MPFNWIFFFSFFYTCTELSWGQLSDMRLVTPPSLIMDRTWSVPSTDPVGSIVTRVKAIDRSGASLIFGLEEKQSYNDAEGLHLPFTINNKTGVVYVNDSLENRAGTDFLLYVTADNGAMPAKAEVWVKILNGSDNGAEVNFRKPPASFLPAIRKPSPYDLLPLSNVPIPTRPPQIIPATKKVPLSTTQQPLPDPKEVEQGDPTKTANISENEIFAKASTNEDGIRAAAVDPLWMTLPTVTSVTLLFLVAGGLAWAFRNRLCNPRPKNTKEDMRKESGGGLPGPNDIVLGEPIAAVLGAWRGPRAHSNRYEGWDSGDLTTAQTNFSDDCLKTPADKWEYPRHRLKVFNIVGEGCFGQVYRCEAQDIDDHTGTTVVAVKTLKENATEKERSDLIQELQVMKMLEPHQNVVRLLGCCTDKDPLFVIMEFVPCGKLQSFLRNSRAEERQYGNLHGPSQSLTSKDLISFVYQVARGMEFLSSKGIIHRDLAARNVLVGEDLVCKVADFGFARDIMASHVYERKSEGRLPIRWMAPESLYDNLFSVKSDVWSFGVLIWEIVTLGSTPYPGLAAGEVMKKVREGLRLAKPEHCKRELYNIMYYCWNKDSNERPVFNELVTLLEELLLTETDYIELERFPDHSYYNMVSLSGEKL